MKYLIFGSCVSRDIFGISERNTEVQNYFARSSVVSVMSEPVEVSLEDIVVESKFQQKMVKYDCNKEVLRALEKQDYDFIIIDFIDERFGVWRIKQNGVQTYITASNEAKLAGLDVRFGAERIFSSEKNKLWEGNCKKFANILYSFAEAGKVILHEAYWVKQYVENGEIFEFDSELANVIERNNKILSEYYELFKSLMPDTLKIISIDNAVADMEHKWGLNPIHYTKEYYFEQMQYIDEIAGQSD